MVIPFESILDPRIPCLAAWLVANKILVYWEYINTDANPSDIISREFKYKDNLPMNKMTLPWWCRPDKVEEQPLMDFITKCFNLAEGTCCAAGSDAVSA